MTKKRKQKNNLKQLELSWLTEKALVNSGVTTVGKLIKYSKIKLKGLREIGMKRIEEIDDQLKKKLGIRLKKGIVRNNSKIDPLSRKRIVAEWLAFPRLLRELNPRQLETLGLDVGEFTKSSYLMLKNKVELGKFLQISDRQIYNIADMEDVINLKKEEMKKWFSKSTPNIILALYRKAIEEGDAARVKLWMQIIEEWKERSEWDLGEETRQTLQDIQEGFQKVCGRYGGKEGNKDKTDAPDKT